MTDSSKVLATVLVSPVVCGFVAGILAVIGLGKAIGAGWLVLFLTGTLQGLFTITLGGILKAAGKRDTPYFRPPEHSAVSGFFGWIYYATIFELWAYATES